MSKILKYLPELEGEEQINVAQLMKPMSEEQAERFSHVYRQRRKDPTITLLTSLLGLVVVAGVHRFMLGQIGMGLLYLFTGGLCLVGTIVDVFNHKSLTYKYNQQQALEVASLIQGAIPGRTSDPDLLTG
ncbi:MAG: TM2 domain-containing protein [Rhodothermales bacterium]